MDELVSFVGKRSNKVWTAFSTALPSHLIVAFETGARGASVEDMVWKTRARTVGPVRIATDGFSGYNRHIETYFGANAAHLSIVKEVQPGSYRVKRVVPVVKTGGVRPGESVSTAKVERLNLSLRQEVAAFNRKTLKHSKKPEYHAARVALFATHYNFVRPHMGNPGGITPAMQAGLCWTMWSIEELVEEALNAPEPADLLKPVAIHQRSLRDVGYRAGFLERLAEIVPDEEAAQAYISPLVHELRWKKKIHGLRKVGDISKSAAMYRKRIRFKGTDDSLYLFFEKKGRRVRFTDVLSAVS